MFHFYTGVVHNFCSRNKSTENHNMSKIATNKSDLTNKPDKSDEYAE